MTVWVRASASSGPPPLIRMPLRAACETPAMKATGAARISGHGVAATSTASAADRIARQQPGRAGDEQRDRQQQQREAVGQADERRLRGLRRRHHAHDAGIGALAGGGGGAHLEGLAGIDRAAARGLAACGASTGIGSPVSADFVDHGARAGDHAVDRHDLAGAHQDRVADRDLLDRRRPRSLRRAGDARCAARGRRAISDRARRARRRNPRAHCRRHT